MCKMAVSEVAAIERVAANGRFIIKTGCCQQKVNEWIKKNSKHLKIDHFSGVTAIERCIM